MYKITVKSSNNTMSNFECTADTHRLMRVTICNMKRFFASAPEGSTLTATNDGLILYEANMVHGQWVRTIIQEG